MAGDERNGKGENSTMTSAKQANPYYGPLHTAFERLVLVNATQFHLSGQLKQRAKDLKRVLNRKNRKYLMGAVALIICDLTDPHAPGFPNIFPVGGHQRQGLRYLRALDEVMSRQSAWTVAEAFEAFEAYLQGIAAIYLKRNPSALSNASWKLRYPKNGTQPKTRRLTDYREFVRRQHGSADDLIKNLRKAIPAITPYEKKNRRNIDLVSFLSVAAPVRHATVHQRGVLSSAELNKLGSDRQMFLRAWFPGKQSAKGYVLALKDEDAERTLNTFAEYAFLIYKQASAAEHLDYNVFKSVKIWK